MAEKGYFFDSTEDDKRIYQAADFARFHEQIIGNGVSNSKDLPDLEVTAKDNMDVELGAGYMFANGYMYENDSSMKLKHDTADPDNDRIDRVVVRFDSDPEERKITARIKKGKAGDDNPPSLTRDEYVYEMSVAQVKIHAGQSYVEDDDITDERADDDVCGYIPLHNIYRGMVMSELGIVSMPNQSYVQMNDYSMIRLDGDNDGPPYIYTNVDIDPDIDRQDEIKDGIFYPKTNGTYFFELHARITPKLSGDDSPKFDGRLFINDLPEDDYEDAESFFNEYAPVTQGKGSVMVYMEKGDKARIKLGILRHGGTDCNYRRVTIAKIN